jgi:GAF domain-containing protein
LVDEDISLMSSIARQCGLAIQNASLYLQLEQDKKNLEEEIWGHKAWF